jgi:ethanolamine utilization protein EutA (predicted chaperonin)
MHLEASYGCEDTPPFLNHQGEEMTLTQIDGWAQKLVQLRNELQVEATAPDVDAEDKVYLNEATGHINAAIRIFVGPFNPHP